MTDIAMAGIAAPDIAPAGIDETDIALAGIAVTGDLLPSKNRVVQSYLLGVDTPITLSADMGDDAWPPDFPPAALAE